MKKFFVLTGLLLIGVCAFAQEEYTYSPKFVQHIKACAKYTDEYTTKISTGDVNSPYLKLKSTEQVLGWLNGRCMTKSTVYSYDLEKDILSIKCALSRQQLANIIQKMKDVNNSGTKEAKKVLQDELTKLIEDSSTCHVNNYLKENDK